MLCAVDRKMMWCGVADIDTIKAFAIILNNFNQMKFKPINSAQLCDTHSALFFSAQMNKISTHQVVLSAFMENSSWSCY